MFDWRTLCLIIISDVMCRSALITVTSSLIGVFP